MNLKIVHLATDGVAGMPFKLVDAIRRNSEVDIHLIETKKRDKRPQDLVFFEDEERCIELIEKADIIHFHNNLDLDSNAYNPIDFNQLHRKGTRFVRQFHSVPSTIARKMGQSVEEILSSDIPSLVIGQFQERFYPDALVVPNCLPIFDPAYIPSQVEEFHQDVVFSPTKFGSAWSIRWNTKGAPETQVMLDRVSKSSGATTRTITRRPLHELLYEKQHTKIVLDDMVTGSYHLSGLEGLSMGKPTLAYLDHRTEFIMRELSGASHTPFVNVRLEDAEPVLTYLLKHDKERQEIGSDSRTWMEQYWSEERLVPHFLTMYSELMENPELVSRQPEFRIEGVNRFYSITLPDLKYQARAKRRFYSTLKIRFADSRKHVKKKFRRSYHNWKRN